MDKEAYGRYTKSRHWKLRREAYYWAMGGPAGYACCVAGCTADRRLSLNHLSYARLGREKDEDLCWLCEDPPYGNGHHAAFHRGEVKVSVYRGKQLVKRYFEPPCYLQ